MEENYITVTQLTRYIKYKIDNDPNLNRIYLKGEISNFKAHSRGHFYFTIKDENSRINAIMFASSASKVKFMPEDGMKVLVSGRVSVYEATGAYQIYVDEMTEDGVGNLYIAFEQLKKKLAKEGLFDPAHKKPIPKMPEKIGIITAPTGAAIRDILSTIKRRWPIAETILFPSLVQGAEAAEDIVRNIELTKSYDLDVLIIGRGGGSIEDMWCFNEEIVARAIYDLDTPVVSAVGHEIDFTISDYVADLRAPTPTGAAEMVVPNKQDFFDYLNQIYIRINKGINNTISQKNDRLKTLINSYVLKNPLNIYEVKEQKFDNLFEQLIRNINVIIEKNKDRRSSLEEHLLLAIDNNLKNSRAKFTLELEKLETLNPISTIKRGYGIVRINGKVLESAKKTKKDDNLEIELKDGKVKARVC